jgi:hypothetical protein
MRWVLVISLALVAASARAGHVHLSAGISLFRPPEPGADATPLYRLSASYWFAKRTSADVEVAYASYRIGDAKYYYVPTKLRVIGHPRAGRLLDPYVGGGFVYSYKKANASRWRDQLGYTALIGLNFLILRKTTVGAYGEYVVPDWRRTQGYWEYGFNFSGLSL